MGDEIILSAMIDTFCRNDIDRDRILVISNDPTDTCRIHGVRAIMFNDIPSLVKVLNRSSVCVLGGGGLIKDGSCATWLGRLALFRLFGAKTMCYAVGVSPLRNRLDVGLARLVLNHFVDNITVRDAISREILTRLGIRRPIMLSADPAVSLRVRRGAGRAPEIPTPIFGLCLKEYDHEDLNEIRRLLDRRSYIKNLARECDSILERNSGTLIMIPSAKADLQDMWDVHEAMSGRERTRLVEEVPGIVNFCDMIGSVDVLISQRLHPLVLGSLLLIPVIAVPYCLKVLSYVQELGLGEFHVKYEQLGEGRLSEMVGDLLGLPEEVSMRMKTSMNILKIRERISVDTMKHLLADEDRIVTSFRGRTNAPNN